MRWLRRRRTRHVFTVSMMTNNALRWRQTFEAFDLPTELMRGTRYRVPVYMHGEDRHNTFTELDIEFPGRTDGAP